MRTVWLGALAAICAGCAAPDGGPPAEPLPSWNDGAVRGAILDFVARVTDPEDPGFVAPADRVAVLDNDGTLIVERPELVQMDFVHQRVRALAAQYPEWQDQAAFRAVLDNDQAAVGAMDLRARGALVNAVQAGLGQAAFRDAARAFLVSSRHPRFGRPYTALVYQPMLELIDYLHDHGFRVFVVSSGGIEFIRQFSEPVYGVPKEHVIGSVMKYELREVGGEYEVWRKAGFQSLNAGSFKVLNIDRHIGRRPILAVGNSDGDIAMLRYAGVAPGALVLLLHHDDAGREYAYDDNAERALAAAQERGWLVVSMAGDFRQVFPGDLP